MPSCRCHGNMLHVQIKVSPFYTLNQFISQLLLFIVVND